MKKIILTIGICFIIAACSNQEMVEDSMDDNTENTCFKKRSFEEALAIAEHSMTLLESPNSTRASSSRKISLKDTKAFKYDMKTRSGQTVNDTLIYVFNFEDSEGFALVSASKAADGLLAVTESGYCNPDSISGIAGFDQFVDLAKQYVLNSPKNGLLPIDTCVSIREEIEYTYSYVGPYVTVRWGQTNPEGECCPNGVAGCVNTASAQIMTYFEYPDSIQLTYDGAPVNYQLLNWTQMKNHNTGHVIKPCNNASAHQAIARLHRQLGKINHSNYDSGATGTNGMFIRYALNGLGYNVSGICEYESSIVRSLLNSHHVLLMYNNSGANGHAWVFDGYLTENAHSYLMQQIGDGPWVIVEDWGVTTTYYNHFNWGWYGTNNGYFNQNVYNPVYVKFPDTNSHWINQNFSNIEYVSVSL